MAELHEARPNREYISVHKVGPYQLRIVGLCGLACLVSGFGLVLPGYVAPILSRELALAPASLSAIFVAAGLGNVLGEFVCSPLADRFGRRRIIIGCLLFAAPFLLLTATANSAPELVALQFLALFGLMGAVPNALALAAGYAPKSMRITLTTFVWLGFEFGAIGAGPMTAYIAPATSWRSVFVVAAAMCIVVCLILFVFLPDSLDILARQRADRDKFERITASLGPYGDVLRQELGSTPPNRDAKFPLNALFRNGQAAPTLLLWTAFFANMLALFFVNTWLPSVLHRAGFSESTSVLLTALVHAGGLIGGLSIAMFCDHVGDRKFLVLAGAYALASLSIAGVAFSTTSLFAVTIAVLLLGFFTFGVQNTANAVAPAIYPAATRGTGAGWAIGVGNSAQVVAPILGGLLVSHNVPVQTILLLVAIPPILAAAASLGVARLTPKQPAT